MNPFLELVIILVIAALAFTAGYFFRSHDYEAGRIAGENEERSYVNARVMEAKLLAWQGGVRFGCEMRDALMSRRAGNVSGIPFPIANHEVTPHQLPRDSARYAEEVGPKTGTARG